MMKLSMYFNLIRQMYDPMNPDRKCCANAARCVIKPFPPKSEPQQLINNFSDSCLPFQSHNSTVNIRSSPFFLNEIGNKSYRYLNCNQFSFLCNYRLNRLTYSHRLK